MKNRRLIGNGLLLGWLLTLSGCGLFRNTSKHRESVRTENQQSERRLRDSATYHMAQTADFSVSVAHGVTETGIGFVAEGNAVIHPDGTVSADQVRGTVSHTGTTTSTKAVESHQQRRALEVVSEINEMRQSAALEQDTFDKKSKANWVVFIMLFVIAALLWISRW